MEKYLNFEEYFESKDNRDLFVVDHEVPKEVKTTTMNILKGIFDKVRDSYFHSTSDGLNLVEFVVIDDDFRFADPEEDLEMEMTPGVKRKREYDVTLKFHDKIDDSNTLIYEVTWTDVSDIEDDEEIDEVDELSDDDDWYKSDDEDKDNFLSKDFVNKERRLFPDDEYIPGEEYFEE